MALHATDQGLNKTGVILISAGKRGFFEFEDKELVRTVHRDIVIPTISKHLIAEHSGAAGLVGQSLNARSEIVDRTRAEKIGEGFADHPFGVQAQHFGAIGGRVDDDPIR